MICWKVNTTMLFCQQCSNGSSISAQYSIFKEENEVVFVCFYLFPLDQEVLAVMGHAAVGVNAVLI